MRNLQDALQEAATALHKAFVNLTFSHARPYLTTTETVLCKENSHACDRIQLGTIMRFMLSAGFSKLPFWTDQHLVIAPGNPPSVSASEFILTFKKEDNLSCVLPRLKASVFGSPPDSREDAKHAACGVVKKVYQDLTQRWKEVCGIKGLM